jgi:hypothetical protein
MYGAGCVVRRVAKQAKVFASHFVNTPRDNDTILSYLSKQHPRGRDHPIAKENPEFAYVPSATIEIRPIKTKEEETAFVYPTQPA